MKEVIQHVKKLNEDETFSLTRDSKVVAIRWDLVEWGLVFDLDVPLGEGDNVQLYRAWLIFKGISEINIPLENVRLPNGFFLTSYINVEKSDDNFEAYSFNALLPTYDVTNHPMNPVAKSIIIKAKEICGVRSIKTIEADNFGFLKRNTRINLASDIAMLNEI